MDVAWNRRTPLRAFIPYGLNRLMAATVNLSKFLMPFNVYTASSLEDALVFIQTNAGELSSNHHRPDVTQTPAQFANDPVQQLLAHIGRIDWEVIGQVEDVSARIDPSLQPVYGAIGRIKSDVDDLIREKARIEEALKIAREELENRVRERTANLWPPTGHSIAKSENVVKSSRRCA
jgi:hypothetical protein